ncbi:MAG TPA: hypothetical protein VL485_11830 [Ktedonobacteraceae bacterium]|nr:hypothetical protein [Ktedonobacteraceae bacterium]
MPESPHSVVRLHERLLATIATHTLRRRYDVGTGASRLAHPR